MLANPPISSGLLLRPANQRFHTQLEWLDSWHSFSFSSHFDPAWMGFGPLRVINDDTIAPGRGFGMHPHRDMEIITVMVEGQLNHHDSMGHSAELHAGEVQRMSAGTGIVHSEMNGGDRPCRLLQIWIEPGTAGLPPAYEQQPFLPQRGWTLLLHPKREEGAMAISASVRVWRAHLSPNQNLLLPPAAGPLGWIQMITGSATPTLAEGSDARELGRGDGLGFSAGSVDAAPIRSVHSGADGADLLLFDLAPPDPPGKR